MDEHYLPSNDTQPFLLKTEYQGVLALISQCCVSAVDETECNAEPLEH